MRKLHPPTAKQQPICIAEELPEAHQSSVDESERKLTHQGGPSAAQEWMMAPFFDNRNIDFGGEDSTRAIKRRRLTTTTNQGNLPAQRNPSTQYPFPFSIPSAYPHLPATSPLSAPWSTHSQGPEVMPPIRPLQATELRRPSEITLPSQDSSAPARPIIDTPQKRELAWYEKIQNLGLIAPPVNTPIGPRPPSGAATGCFIAIEGDDEKALAQVASWLSTELAKCPDCKVRMWPGPTLPPMNRQSVLADYLGLILAWQKRTSDIRQFLIAQTAALPSPSAETQSSPFITTTGDANTSTFKDPNFDMISPTDTTKPNSVLSDDHEALIPATNEALGCVKETGTRASSKSPTGQIPILLMKQYQYHACNVWASHTPIIDAYGKQDHWQWMATLWRGTIGPSLTVFVRDCAAVELTIKGKIVQVAEELRCVMIRKPRGQVDLDEATLRRVAFEVIEWIRGLSEANK